VERFLRWVDASAIPGAYSTPAQRAAQRDHPGDLTHTRIFQASGPHSVTSGRHWPHTKPNQVYQDDEAARERMVAAVAWLLRRGMSRLQDAVLLLLREVAAAEVQPLLALARRALNSFEDFWRSVRWTVAYGPRQTEWRVEDEMKEYGPETNFWLKFRPLLACQHAPRLGPELGGAKAWCNPHAWPRAPRHILSAGAGDDMLYESIVARLWPGVTVVTLDCFQYTEESAFSPPKWGGSEMLMLPVCLSGKDPAYADLAPRQLRERFVTYPQLLADLRARHGVEGFEFIKCNIEASEYPLFADVMQDPDANLRGTLQINIEMHRMGMHDYADVPPSGGRDFNSLLFMQLLWATFLSGGFHPVFVEKWHDRNAAADVVWVNQTFWLHSELDAARTIWDREWPDVPLAESTYPDAAELASQHARGVDPYRAPTATRTLERQQKVTGAAGLENTAALSGGGAMAGSDGTSAVAPAAGASGANKVRKLSAKRLRELKKAPALVMVDPTGCEQCAELLPMWSMIAENFEQLAGRRVPAFRLVCDEDMALCAALDKGSTHPGFVAERRPVFGVHSGEGLEVFTGERNPQALLQWLRQAISQPSTRAQLIGADGDVMPRPGMEEDVMPRPGIEEDVPLSEAEAAAGKRWAQLPVEIVEDLSASDFLARYTNRELPVILRRRHEANDKTRATDIAFLRTECAEGGIHVFERAVGSTAWGGFKGAPVLRRLGDYLDRLEAANDTEHYGFDLKTACDCAALLDRMEQLVYFQADDLLFDLHMPGTNWPSLIVGPAGSRSALHVDTAFLPFWLTLLGGHKTFRVVTRADWRRHLASGKMKQKKKKTSGGESWPPLYETTTGAALRPVEAFDDEWAERELIGRGATVWNGTLEVGDTIYIPTGALHGALNTKGRGAAVALSGNFLDAAHVGQVREQFCQWQTLDVRASNSICARLDHPPSYGDHATAEARATELDTGPRGVRFWDWLLSRPGWCAKYTQPQRACAAASARCPPQ